jgi:uncharacterized coiled-coil protein SlyX
MRIRIALFFAIYLFTFASHALAADIESRLDALEKTIRQQGRTIEEQQRVIDELREELKKTRQEAVTKQEEVPKPQEKTAAPEKVPQATGLFGASSLMNPNISLILDTFGYTSNLSESALRNRGIPGYTDEGITNRKGFNLDSAELYFFAPVDPYFNLYATIPVTEDGVELEEAYFLTTSLPYGLQVKGGKFKSGLGRINGQHPHAWDFADAPLAYRAFMGGEGITEKGVQITYLPPLPVYTLLGIEVLQGDNSTLFGPDARSGPHAFTAFAKASVDLSDNATVLVGQSVIAGSTKTETVTPDTEFSGTSALYDTELTYKWKPSKFQSLVLQSEYLYRHQRGDLSDLGPPEATLSSSLKRDQDGLYLQGVYQLSRWRLGARYDVLSLLTSDYILAGDHTDFGPKPWRATAMVEFNPTEFSRIRLQYNHDESDPSQRVNNEWILQFIFGIGAHGAHPF